MTETSDTSYEVHAERCPVCKGFGTVKYGELVCRACKGNGYIYVPNRLDQIGGEYEQNS